MSKIACTCGNIISDNSDNLGYKAHFIRNQDLNAADQQTLDISAFIDSIKNGTRNQWIDSYFDSTTHKLLSDKEIVFFITINYMLKYNSDMFLCDECGRVIIQKGMENKYIGFTPEDNQWPFLFNGLSKK
jgi:hypothetical protein